MSIPFSFQNTQEKSAGSFLIELILGRGCWTNGETARAEVVVSSHLLSLLSPISVHQSSSARYKVRTSDDVPLKPFILFARSLCKGFDLEIVSLPDSGKDASRGLLGDLLGPVHSSLGLPSVYT